MVVDDCNYYINIYGPEDFVKDFCNDYYYGSALATH